MDKLNQLRLYKRALWKYKLSLYFPFLKSLLGTEFGFCHHFYISCDWKPFSKSLNNYGAENVPNEYYLSYLHKQATYEILHGLEFLTTSYWWPIGEIEPRIKALKAAIREIEEDYPHWP